jgi:hypothetical protein
MWGRYLWRTQWMDAFYFALDVPELNRPIQLQQLVSWCKGGIDPKDGLILRARAAEWPLVGKTKKKEEDFPSHMKPYLGFAKEWYDHYTLRWGAHIRCSDNLLGEGD